MDEFAKLYLDNLEEDKRNRMGGVQHIECFLALLDYIDSRFAKKNNK